MGRDKAASQIEDYAKNQTNSGVSVAFGVRSTCAFGQCLFVGAAAALQLPVQMA